MHKKPTSGMGVTGQSFVELALVLAFLLLLVAGMVQIGFFMFSYLTALDLTREAARFASTRDFTKAKSIADSGECNNSSLNYYFDTACFFTDSSLNPTIPITTTPYSDVTITVFTVTDNHVTDRWPKAPIDSDGDGVWSLYDNNWQKDCDGNTVQTEPFFTNAEIESKFISNATRSKGLVLVEVFYCYNQILDFPVISRFIPSPFRIHAFTIMPYPEAIPTPTPIAYPLGEDTKMFKQRLKDRMRGIAKSIRPHKDSRKTQKESAQALVILAVSFLALIAFIGLVVDVGSLYVTYTQLKRAVDAAAVAAANNIKYPHVSAAERVVKITESAREMLALHDINNLASLQVKICTDSGLPAEFSQMCPDVAGGESPRKLAWVQATENSPVYFLSLFGVQSMPITANAVGEAATVDLVLVFDTSESMGKDSPGYDPNNFDPGPCNSVDNCQPLRQAKDAAKSLVGDLYDGYDQVAVVSFDYSAQIIAPLNSDLSAAETSIDSVTLHDDAPTLYLTWAFPNPVDNEYKTFNPIFPDDRDGDGNDADPGAPCTDLVNNLTGAPPRDLWDDTIQAPCDSDDFLDAFDWNNNGDHDDDHTIPGVINLDGKDPTKTGTYEQNSLLSTCTGCGIRVGKEVLQAGGRPASVWVMVFLSDGVANLSDTHLTEPKIDASFTYGFCGSDPATSFWKDSCIDWNSGFGAGRYCIDDDPSTCPPGAEDTTTSGPYSVEDYALDMTDEAALLVSTNPFEPNGEDILIYSVGLGAASNGEALLRYMANVGDVDGSRANDQCAGVPTRQNCGNYYYAPTGAYLDQIFESIAAHIFTKISR